MRRIIDKAVYTTSSTQPTHIDGIYIYIYNVEVIDK